MLFTHEENGVIHTDLCGDTMSLENFGLGQSRPAQEAARCRVLFLRHIRNRQLHGGTSVVARGRGREEWRLTPFPRQNLFWRVTDVFWSGGYRHPFLFSLELQSVLSVSPAGAGSVDQQRLGVLLLRTWRNKQPYSLDVRQPGKREWRSHGSSRVACIRSWRVSPHVAPGSAARVHRDSASLAVGAWASQDGDEAILRWPPT